ncbi:AraC family transcriptional regulator [Streptomyces sp. DSM 41014]|uniref:AraC family transcriptional regulator n=1 Tax=Streptomyces hintoniae TaxID=3075521 RepID=A0ABU2UYA2_9ACTN|nr:AraC family transcriptional regulator [Streptomyces sp. DSM 41014]MDT0477777.1 AraC family transcriptional regulator [Streptomyces sp. DSM 41014]
MDFLSEAIGSVRTGRSYARRVTETGSWGMRYDEFTGSGFHVVLRGRGWLVTEDAPPRALRPGDVVLVAAGARHGLSHAPRALRELPPATMDATAPHPGPADFEFLCGAYHLRRGRAYDYLATLPDIVVTSPEKGPSWTTSLAELLVADLSAPGPGADATRSALVDLLLVHVVRQWLQDNGTADGPYVDDPVIASALRHIHSAPYASWRVSELSAAVGMSRTAFTRHFTRVLGKPPRDYLTGVRLSRAARLLRESDAPLAAVARELGYSTEFAFGAAFRREYGISPGRFRDAPDTLPPAAGAVRDDPLATADPALSG